MTMFADFVAALEARHGVEAQWARHELFFQSRRRWPLVRAWSALLRDALTLRRASRRGVAGGGAPLAVMVATLAGGSGWGTLERALPAISAAGLRPVILAHPRLPDEMFPPDLTVLRPGGVVSRWAWGRVGAAMARHDAWRRAVAAALEGLHGVLLLHNDFDMMSAAALRCGWPSVCLQHGIPTDEYFPARADYQVVWGQGPALAYGAAGYPGDRLVVDALGRGRAMAPTPSHPPQGIAVVSQLHAAIFGPDLPAALRAFVAELLVDAPDALVLLHPNERGRSGYGSARVSLPPHPALAASRPALVLAWCSTMAIDAALAGHWVAAVDFDMAGNDFARSVACPPLRVRSALEVFALRQRLTDDESFRRQTASRQEAWLAQTFSAEGGGLRELLRKIAPPCPSC